MYIIRKNGSTSNILRTTLRSSSTGAGLTGLTSASSGLVISTICDNEATATAYTVAGSTIESITTLGTFATPTVTKCRFKEVDATNHPGLYEFQFANARFAVAVAKILRVTISGASGLLAKDMIVQLSAVDFDDVIRLGLTALPNAVVAAAGGLLVVGSGSGAINPSGGKVPATLAAADVSGNLPADLQTIKTQAVTASAAVTFPAAIGNSTYAGADTVGTTTLLSRLTASRSGYLDNLNVGGAVATQADILSLNQSASRRVLLTTVLQYERPESESVLYRIEARTYDGDGIPTNADGPPTLLADGSVSGSLAGNLSGPSNTGTGVYLWLYSVASAAVTEEIRLEVQAVIDSIAFDLACYTQVVDLVAVTWTSTDAAHLTSLFNKLPSKSTLAGTDNADGSIEMDAATGDYPGSVGSVASPVILTTAYDAAKSAAASGASMALTSGAMDAVSARVISDHGAGSYVRNTEPPTVVQVRQEIDSSSTVLAAIMARLPATVLAALVTMLEDAGSGLSRFTADALVNAPTGGSGGGGGATAGEIVDALLESDFGAMILGDYACPSDQSRTDVSRVASPNTIQLSWENSRNGRRRVVP